MKTLDDLMRAVSDMTFCGGLSLWRPRVSMFAHPDNRRSIHLVVQMCVPDRQDGADILIEVRREYDRVTLESFDLRGFEAVVMSIVRQAFQHELDEGVLFNGARLFDPHPPTSSSAPRPAHSAADSAARAPR